MAEPAARASASAGEALSDDELQQAFGGDLGPGPGASAEVPVPAPGSAESVHPEPETRALETTPTWDEFTHGWQLGIYRDPVVCGVLAGAVLAVLGVFVVLRRAVFVTAAVSQAAALGVATAFLIDIRFHTKLPPVLGALVFALLATAALTSRMQRVRLPGETVVGLIYLVCSAGAVLVGDRIAQESHDIAGILFGTAVMVRPEDLALVGGVGLFTLVVIAIAFRGLLFVGFDPEGASVHGLPVRLLELLLWMLVALEVSVTTRAIGALPVFAFAVLPAMAALALAERVRWALVLSGALGGLAGGLGYLFAFFYEFPVGASQAAIALVFLLACLPLARAIRGSAA